MSDIGGVAKLVPGFDFLQNLAKTAGAAIPGMGGFGQWVAPTLDPTEIEKRISELKTVQYWLEQNARMLAATIQALEVQRMTLTTLKTMNLQLGDLKAILPSRPPAVEHAPAAPAPSRPATRHTGDAPAGKAKGTVIDPMQWWSALTNQFTQLATDAIKGGASSAGGAAAIGAAKALAADKPKAAKKRSGGTRRRPTSGAT